MKKLLAVMAAALALGATQVAAEGGGGAGGAGGSGSSEGAGGGAASGSQQDRTDQSDAQQKAPSVTGTEGAGGKRPQPQAQGQGDERRYGEAPAQPSGQQGRPATETPPSQATGTPAQPATNLPGQQPSEVSGRVALVSEADAEIGIDAGTSTTQIKIAPDAEITVNGKRSSLKDIRQGAQIRASLERGEDGLHAKKVEVTSSAGGK